MLYLESVIFIIIRVNYKKNLKKNQIVLKKMNCKGYYKEALEEFENALEIRKKLSVNVDIAITHRFLGETLCKLGENYERAKLDLDMYYSMTLRMNDLVVIGRE
jgi:tetratricopeptide (TPR) repeat protein